MARHPREGPRSDLPVDRFTSGGKDMLRQSDGLSALPLLPERRWPRRRGTTVASAALIPIVLGMLTKVAQNRRDFLCRHRGDVLDRILEIGAFDNPTSPSGTGDRVEVSRFLLREELIAMHRDNRRGNLSAAVEVDHVVKSSDFATKLTPGFDLVVAHHVIEHVPDPIFWFEQIEQLLAPGGSVFLSFRIVVTRSIFFVR